MIARFYNPWSDIERDLRTMQGEMNRLFSRYDRETATAGFPAINVWAEGDNAIVTAEIPGVSNDDLDISVTGNVLTLKGKRGNGKAGEGATYHRRERRTGDFSRTMELPFNIDADNVGASLSKGILQVTLPKAESDKPKKIAIK